jgi:uncharacterized protein (TIGR02145 family)
MKKSIILFLMMLPFIASIHGQRPLIELTFTGTDNGSYVQLDSIRVMNRTLGVDTVLYYPDTVLVLECEYPAGIDSKNENNSGLKICQNYPNPADEQTIITIYVPGKNTVNLMITDLMGRQVVKTENLLDKGYHLFSFSPGDGELFFFKAECEGNIAGIKILHNPSKGKRTSSLDYIGCGNSFPDLKTTRFVQNFEYFIGDDLLYIGYANTLQSGIPDSPEASETDTFQFATNIPCPGTPTITYDGQVYNTIQIFSQCWMKENLNAGIRIEGSQNMTNNGIMEKYCYDDMVTNCNIYGALYSWGEMMKYTSTEGAQGICPDGWHLPSDNEWKLLEGAVDSVYGIGNAIWNTDDFRGFDAGQNLKSTSATLWLGGEGTDNFGFTGLPGGMKWGGGNYTYDGCYGFYWSSSLYRSSAWRRILICAPDDYALKVGKDTWDDSGAMSVRCLKD